MEENSTSQIQRSMDNSIISRVRYPKFENEIARDRARIKETEECFTPTWLVQKGLDEYEKLIPDIFSNPVKTFIDNSSGSGQFLSEVLIRKIQNGISHKQAISTIYGVELQQDNVNYCRERLLAGVADSDLIAIIEQNIVCADALRYHYRFDGSPPYDDEVLEQKKEEHFNTLFEYPTQGEK